MLQDCCSSFNALLLITSANIPDVAEGIFTSKGFLDIDLVAHILRELFDKLFTIALSFLLLNRCLGLLNGIGLLL